jgi:predicted nucleic acid-binding protein
LVAVTSELTLAEVLVKPYQLDRAELIQAYESFLEPDGALQIEPVTASVLRDAARLRARSRLRVPDAIHAATAVTAGCSALLTNDQDLRRFQDVPVKLDGTFGPLKESTDIDAINLQLALGKTDFTITGKTVGRNTSLNISAPVINTANLPVALPLQKPVDVKNLRLQLKCKDGRVVKTSPLSSSMDGDGRKGYVRLETPPFTAR